MKAHLTPALAVALVLATTACEARGSSAEVVDEATTATQAADQADPGAAFTGASWEAWSGVYSDVRPATDEVIAELRARVAARNETSWTAEEAGSGAEIAYTPDHLRASWGYVDLHVDPRTVPDVFAPFTVCDEADCHLIDPADDDSEETADALPPTAAWIRVLLDGQLMGDIEDVLDEGIVSLASVESPIGPLDCLVHAETKKEVHRLEGSALVVGSGSMHQPWASWCVDERGVVVLGPSEAGFLQYTSWQPGVDADVTELVPAVGDDAAPVDPAGAYEQVRWSTWEGVYRDVRPAAEADVDAVRERVLALNATSWTAVVDEWGFTLSVTPGHVRADFGGGVEVHLDPNREPYVLCAQGECVRIGPDANADGPHLTNDFLDGMTFYVQAMVFWQRRDGALRSQEPTVIATVDSPVGPLDCLFLGPSGRDPRTLEGTSAVPDPENPPVDGAGSPLCVDQRGLVVRTQDLMTPVIAYSSWHEGVDGDIDTYPAPVVDYNDRND